MDACERMRAHLDPSRKEQVSGEKVSRAREAREHLRTLRLTMIVGRLGYAKMGDNHDGVEECWS